MNRLPFLFVFPLTMLLAAACGKPADCTYTYDATDTKLEWTAYKFTKKVGVKGTFTGVRTVGTVPGRSPVEVFQKLEFSIPIASLDSKAPDRDQKIRSAFFGTMKATQELTGRVLRMSPDGTATLSLSLNGQTREVPAKFRLSEDGLFSADLAIDVTEWGAGPSVAALNKICQALHTGEDGKSKLWPNVDISVSTRLNKACR